MEPPLSVCQRLFKEEDQGAEDKTGDNGPWLVLSGSQRSSLRQRGFVVLDALAPASLAAEAYDEVSFDHTALVSPRIVRDAQDTHTPA